MWAVIGPDIGRFRPSVADWGLRRPILGRSSLDADQVWPALGQDRPMLVELGQMLTNTWPALGRTSYHDFGRISTPGANLARWLDNFGARRARARQISGARGRQLCGMTLSSNLVLSARIKAADTTILLKVDHADRDNAKSKGAAIENWLEDAPQNSELDRDRSYRHHLRLRWRSPAARSGVGRARVGAESRNRDQLRPNSQAFWRTLGPNRIGPSAAEQPPVQDDAAQRLTQN